MIEKQKNKQLVGGKKKKGCERKNDRTRGNSFRCVKKGKLKKKQSDPAKRQGEKRNMVREGGRHHFRNPKKKKTGGVGKRPVSRPRKVQSTRCTRGKAQRPPFPLINHPQKKRHLTPGNTVLAGGNDEDILSRSTVVV